MGRNYKIEYEHSGNEHAPDWLSMWIEADSEEEALEEFKELGYYASEVIVSHIDHPALEE